MYEISFIFSPPSIATGYPVPRPMKNISLAPAKVRARASISSAWFSTVCTWRGGAGSPGCRPPGGPAAGALPPARGPHRVRGPPARGDQDHERPLRGGRSVPVLGGELHGRGHARDLLQDGLPHPRRVVRRPARDELHAREPVAEEAVRLHLRHPAEERAVDRLGLLVDLLEHEVLEPSPLRVLDRPGDPLRLPFHGLALPAEG